MEIKENKYIRASYQLYDVTDGGRELLEQTSDEAPFSFISGLGILLDGFEREVANLAVGEKFDFELSPELAYGEHLDTRVVELDKSTFFVDGHFDDKNIYPNAIVPLQNEDGNRFNGQVVEITADKVVVDLNHPLAGRRLNFQGEILESREATNEELSKFVDQISGSGSCSCGGSCGCGGEGDCGCGGNGSGDCGCGGSCGCH
jgi:FKBP-type peptidyl-prolyl cis-trans isomerase SlyD